MTVVLVSHDLNLASEYCDGLLLLQQGRPYRIGTPDEIIRPDVLQAVYGCAVLIDQHPTSGLPRVTLPGRGATTPGRLTMKADKLQGELTGRKEG